MSKSYYEKRAAQRVARGMFLTLATAAVGLLAPADGVPLTRADSGISLHVIELGAAGLTSAFAAPLRFGHEYPPNQLDDQQQKSAWPLPRSMDAVNSHKATNVQFLRAPEFRLALVLRPECDRDRCQKLQ